MTSPTTHPDTPRWREALDLLVSKALGHDYAVETEIRAAEETIEDVFDTAATADAERKSVANRLYALAAPLCWAADGKNYLRHIEGYVEHLARRATQAEERLARVREYVDYPGNWSAADGRRRLLLGLIDGEDIEWTR